MSSEKRARSERYQEYLESEHWKTFRAEVLKSRGRKCQKCNSRRNIQIHHLTYERIGHELMEDVQVLCDFCHAAAHGIVKQPEPKPVHAFNPEISHKKRKKKKNRLPVGELRCPCGNMARRDKHYAIEGIRRCIRCFRSIRGINPPPKHHPKKPKRVLSGAELAMKLESERRVEQRQLMERAEENRLRELALQRSSLRNPHRHRRYRAF